MVHCPLIDHTQLICGGGTGGGGNGMPTKVMTMYTILKLLIAFCGFLSPEDDSVFVDFGCGLCG